jgi:hypothetical protein
VIGIAWVLARPAATQRAGEALTRSAGLASTETDTARLPAEGTVAS